MDRNQPIPNPPPRRHLLITIGPTWEAIDAVRYLGNRSSGRLGLALATAALHTGQFDLTLLVGPGVRVGEELMAAHDSGSVRLERFESCADLEGLLKTYWQPTGLKIPDMLIMAAAVADYRPRFPADPSTKIKREPGGNMTIELESTPDLVAACRGRKTPAQRIIGFALEPAQDLAAFAQVKLKRKGLDAIVANPLETMGNRRIEALVYTANHEEPLAPGPMDKGTFAVWLIEQVVIPMLASARRLNEISPTP